MEHYFRTTRWLIADTTTIKVGTNCKIKRLVGGDALNLTEWMRTRNVFARHRGPRDFYTQRAHALVDTTIVEIRTSAISKVDLLARNALVAENAVAASFVLSGGRNNFLRRAIGVTRAYLDLHLKLVGGVKVSSTSAEDRQPTGLRIDERSRARYERNGFARLYETAVGDTELGSRLRAALDWLVASRTDPNAYSALVKTATALESLLVIGREPPTRTLSERAAYLLTDSPDERGKASAATLRFYEARSAVVHGKRPAAAIDRTLEFGDRLVVLLALVLASQATWASASDIQKHCDRIRWGHKEACKRPWSPVHFGRALKRMP